MSSVSSIAASATALSQIQTGNAIQIAVAKKAMNLQAQGAMQLVQAAAQVAVSNPPNLGNTINEFA